MKFGGQVKRLLNSKLSSFIYHTHPRSVHYDNCAHPLFVLWQLVSLFLVGIRLVFGVDLMYCVFGRFLDGIDWLYYYLPLDNLLRRRGEISIRIVVVCIIFTLSYWKRSRLFHYP